MTGLETILEQIKEESNQKAGTIIAEAKKKAEEKLSQVKMAIAETKAAERRAAEIEAEDRIKRGISAAERKGRQQILEKKQALINQAVDMAYQSLVEMDEETYTAFVLKHLKPYAGQSGVLRLVPFQGKGVPEKLAEAIRKEYPELTIAKEPQAGDGGFVLVIGQIEIDMTYQALLHESMEELRDMANRLLFEQEAVQ